MSDLMKQLRNVPGNGDEPTMNDVADSIFGGRLAYADLIGIKSLSIKEIEQHDTLQMRSQGLDQAHLANLIGTLEDGGKIKDPVTVVLLSSFNEDGELIPSDPPRYVLADGYHRIEAHTQTGKRVIKSNVVLGTWEDATILAEEANLKHGLGLSTDDKKQILFSRIDRGYQSNGIPYELMSNGSLASELGVGSETIRRWFDEYATLPNGRVIDRTVTYGRDGRKYDNTAQIEANKRRAAFAKLPTHIQAMATKLEWDLERIEQWLADNPQLQQGRGLPLNHTPQSNAAQPTGHVPDINPSVGLGRVRQQRWETVSPDEEAIEYLYDRPVTRVRGQQFGWGVDVQLSTGEIVTCEEYELTPTPQDPPVDDELTELVLDKVVDADNARRRAAIGEEQIRAIGFLQRLTGDVKAATKTLARFNSEKIASISAVINGAPDTDDDLKKDLLLALNDFLTVMVDDTTVVVGIDEIIDLLAGLDE